MSNLTNMTDMRDKCLFISPWAVIGTDGYCRRSIFECSTKIFHDRLFWIGLRDNVTPLTLWRFQVLAWNFVGWCTIPWGSLLFKWLCAYGGTFPMIGFFTTTNSLRIPAIDPAIGLKFDGMMYSMMKQTAIQNGYARLNVARSVELRNFPL